MINTINIDRLNCFNNTIYSFIDKKWLKEINILSNKYINDCKKINNKEIKQRNQIYKKNVKDHGFVHHSKLLMQEPEFLEFQKYIGKISWDILYDQGYDMNKYDMMIKDIWVQEFPLHGGGNHNTHIHQNSHISGFYFLKCSEKTSYPVFHDPRPGKMMTQLLEKDSSKITQVSEKLNYKPIPGTFLFFNSYMPHEFVVDNGIEPFRFIHFNLQAISKEIVNEKLKHV